MAIIKELAWLLTSYLITFVVSTLLVVYVLQLLYLYWSTKTSEGYYYDNILSTILDIFLIFSIC